MSSPSARPRPATRANTLSKRELSIPPYSRRVRVKVAPSYTMLLERLCKVLRGVGGDDTTTAATKGRWRRLATEWRTGNHPLPLASEHANDSPEYATCMRVFYTIQPLPFGWLLFLLEDVDANVQWCCQLYACYIKGAKGSIWPCLASSSIALLVQYVPDIMVIRRNFFTPLINKSATMHLGALLAADAVHSSAMLAEATVAAALESDGNEEDRLFVTRSTEAALELLFALPSSRGGGFLTEVTRSLTEALDPLCPDHVSLFAAAEIAKRFHGSAERWAARSVWITACVEIGHPN